MGSLGTTQRCGQPFWGLGSIGGEAQKPLRVLQKGWGGGGGGSVSIRKRKGGETFRKRWLAKRESPEF